MLSGPFPEEFAMHFNALKARAEERVTLLGYDREEAEQACNALLTKISAACDGQDVMIVFLACGQVLANILNS